MKDDEDIRDDCSIEDQFFIRCQPLSTLLDRMVPGEVAANAMLPYSSGNLNQHCCSRCVVTSCRRNSTYTPRVLLHREISFGQATSVSSIISDHQDVVIVLER
jgi:hypothetical protein